jgi:hypothetical protein
MITTHSILLKDVVRQYEDLMATSDSLSEAQCRELFPDLIEWILQNVSILDLVDAEAREVAPGVYLVSQGCPDCGNTIGVMV